MTNKYKTSEEIKNELEDIVVEENKERIVDLIETFKNEYLMKKCTKTPFRPEKNIFETFQTLPNDYDTLNWRKSTESIYLDDYLEETAEFFTVNFYRYNKEIFSLMKNEMLPKIKKIIETEDNYYDQESEVIAKKIIANQMWVIIISKNKIAQRALSLLGECRDKMVYKGQREGMSKIDSVEKDLIKHCAGINYDQFKFA